MHTSPHLPIKVDSAVFISEIADDQPAFCELIKPALEQLIHTFLGIMDEIDLKLLVDALQKIIEVYADSVAPFAVKVVKKLQETYIKLIDENAEQEDAELTLTSFGCLQAINKVLLYSLDLNQSAPFEELEEGLVNLVVGVIDGKNRDEYMEEILTTLSYLVRG
jgi:hypothetical protein